MGVLGKRRNVGVKYLRDDLLGKPEFVYANASPSPPQAKRRVWIQDFPFQSNVIVLMDTRFSVLVKSYRPYPSPLHY